MRTTATVMMGVAIGVTVGCESLRGGFGDHGPTNVRMIESLRQTSISSAIIVQRTLYPYHFVSGTTALNELGRHDLAVLGEHLRQHPGAVNVRRGGASNELYASRVAAVRRALIRAGVDGATLPIRNTHAGGTGISSEEMRGVLDADRSPTESTGTAVDRAETRGVSR